MHRARVAQDTGGLVGRAGRSRGAGQPVARFVVVRGLHDPGLEVADGRREVTGLEGGLLLRAERDRVVPKIFYTNSAYEYYGRAASLMHTTLDGSADAPLGTNTRLYVMAGGNYNVARLNGNFRNPDVVVNTDLR